MFLFSLRSKSLDHFNPVFSAPSVASALYMVRQSVNTGSDLNLISDISDFELIQLGSYDENAVFTDFKVCVCDDLTTIPGISIPSITDIRDVSSVQQSYDELVKTYQNLMSDYNLLKIECDIYKDFYSRSFSLKKFLIFIKKIFGGFKT